MKKSIYMSVLVLGSLVAAEGFAVIDTDRLVEEKTGCCSAASINKFYNGLEMADALVQTGTKMVSQSAGFAQEIGVLAGASDEQIAQMAEVQKYSDLIGRVSSHLKGTVIKNTNAEVVKVRVQTNAAEFVQAKQAPQTRAVVEMSRGLDVAEALLSVATSDVKKSKPLVKQRNQALLQEISQQRKDIMAAALATPAQ